MSGFIEALENRVFLSATPVVRMALTTTQVADQQAIAAAQATLATELTTRVSTRAADRTALITVRAADQQAISADLLTTREDRGDRPQEYADQLQLRADRSKLNLDVRDANLTIVADNRATLAQVSLDRRTVAADKVKYHYDLAHHV